VVLEAMLFLCHENRKQSVLVEDVSHVVNQILWKRGVRLLPVQPRGVGAKLKFLGFHTRRLGARGRGFVLTPEIRQQAHRLALRHNPASTQVVDGCSDCHPDESTCNADARMHVVHV